MHAAVRTKKHNQPQGGNQAAASESANTPLAATNELNLYIWSDYSDPSTVTQFGKDNKLTINESFYDSNEMLEAKVLTGKSGYDLVAPSLSNVARQINAGAYRPIDKSQIPNYNNIDPSLLKMMAQVDPAISTLCHTSGELTL